MCPLCTVIAGRDSRGERAAFVTYRALPSPRRKRSRAAIPWRPTSAMSIRGLDHLHGQMLRAAHDLERRQSGAGGKHMDAGRKDGRLRPERQDRPDHCRYERDHDQSAHVCLHRLELPDAPAERGLSRVAAMERDAGHTRRKNKPAGEARRDAAIAPGGRCPPEPSPLASAATRP